MSRDAKTFTIGKALAALVVVGASSAGVVQYVGTQSGEGQTEPADTMVVDKAPTDLVVTNDIHEGPISDPYASLDPPLLDAAPLDEPPRSIPDESIYGGDSIYGRDDSSNHVATAPNDPPETEPPEVFPPVASTAPTPVETAQPPVPRIASNPQPKVGIVNPLRAGLRPTPLRPSFDPLRTSMAPTTLTDAPPEQPASRYDEPRSVSDDEDSGSALPNEVPDESPVTPRSLDASPPIAEPAPRASAMFTDAPADAELAAIELAVDEIEAAEPDHAEHSHPHDGHEHHERETAEDGTTVVKVFYATDRNQIDSSKALTVTDFVPMSIAAGLTLLLGICAWSYASRRKLLIVLAVVGVGVTVYMAVPLTAALVQSTQPREKGPAYGDQRGELQMGVCEVSIPPVHEVGAVESPSILRLEIREDTQKHVVLKSIERLEKDTFFGQLKQSVAESPHKDAFVFVHGYNVTFEKACRRTAQISHDLQCTGAPICYSWPSQGGLFKYTVDETNVVWTVPHLKEFLIDVSEKTGARAINLIAHSMGNRALTSALREMSYDLQGELVPFNQIVLAAPDIDAEVFRRDIAPAVRSMANLVTLYASSNDQALIASKKVHGYARAGDSGADMVVIPGIETVDVSSVDTSLVGHSYYGSNDSILSDLFHLIHDARPAHQRFWLRPTDRNGQTYWVFQGGAPAIAHPGRSSTYQ